MRFLSVQRAKGATPMWFCEGTLGQSKWCHEVLLVGEENATLVSRIRDRHPIACFKQRHILNQETDKASISPTSERRCSNGFPHQSVNATELPGPSAENLKGNMPRRRTTT